MRVNHASTLTVGYFVSYLNLVMLSREINLKEATIYMEKSSLKGTLISMANQQKITINKQFKN
ncbi:hypothetical protein HNO90_001538 [Staphylococcus hominis]|nr:hypothetical protein [Staphylococcus hominis]